MMITMERGHYWIRCRKTKANEIARWTGTHWLMHGDEIGWDHAQLERSYEVGPIIIEPSAFSNEWPTATDPRWDELAK